MVVATHHEQQIIVSPRLMYGQAHIHVDSDAKLKMSAISNCENTRLTFLTGDLKKKITGGTIGA